MKKTCILLLLVVWIVYFKEGYDLFSAKEPAKSSVRGTLSDIAGEVIAIPLETTSNCRIGQVTRIKRDRNDLFLMSDRQVYHFDCSGKFVNQLTDNRHFLVSDYVVDPVNRQLIVLDEKETIRYYDYNETLLEEKSLPAAYSWNTSLKLSYYSHHIWATAKRLTPTREDPNKQHIEQWLYKFDTAFHPLEARKLTPTNLGRFYLSSSFDPEVCVANENVYVHTPSLQPKELLQDTLYLIALNQLEVNADYSSVLPLRIAGRYLISSFFPNPEDKRNYTFCFDRLENHAYNIPGGFDDNFYHTGRIAELQAVDVYNQSFCYSKSGEEIRQSFPDRKEGDNPVLFIVKLKA